MAEKAKHIKKDQVGTKLTDEQKMQYERLIAARNFHYENLNKWLITFYAIIGALFVALYSLHKENGHQLMELCVAFIGYVVSIAAYLSGKGYYYWETNWIMLVHNFEKKHLIDAEKYKKDKEAYLKENKDDYRTYSVFANMEANNDIDKITSGANISTSKVALAITWFITILWGAMVIFFGLCILLQTFCCDEGPLKICCKLLVGLISVITSLGMTLLFVKIGKFFQSDLGGVDDLKLPID